MKNDKIKKIIILFVVILIFNTSLYARLSQKPANVYQGTIEKIDLKFRYLIIDKKKFLFNKNLKKLIKRYKKGYKIKVQYILKNKNRVIMAVIPLVPARKKY